jgi:hypothetical protein
MPPHRSVAFVAVAAVVLGCGAGGDGLTNSSDAVASLKLSGVPDTHAVGESVTATAIAELRSGATRPVPAEWSANPSWLVALTPNGSGETISASGAGTVTITISDGGKSASKTVVVLFERYQRLSALFSDTLRVGRVLTPAITGLRNDAVTVGVFDAITRSSDSGVVAVNGHTLTAVAPGTAELSFESGGVRITRHVTVEPPPVLMDVRVIGPVSPALAQTLQRAIARWQDVLASGWRATAVSIAPNACVAGQPVIANETITGVRVYVAESNAGVAGALARGGACASADGRTVVGRIYVGNDLERSTPATKLAVMTHELGHVLGLMSPPMLLDVPGVDPRWIGAEARRQYVLAGGVDAGGVPLESETEVPSGAYGHWRISKLPDEIMTTYAGRLGGTPEGGPLSAITLGALADLGYPIRMSAADPYRVDKRLPTQVPGRAAP